MEREAVVRPPLFFLFETYSEPNIKINDMKRRTLLIMAALASLFAVPAAIAQTPAGSSPGLVVAASQTAAQLPSSASKFIDRHFKGIGILKCERYFAKGKYEVELANGVDIEFDNSGKVTEIDAPDRATLAASVVKEVVPAKTFKHLEDNGLASKVETVEFKRGKFYEVELAIPSPDTYIFDINGNFIIIDD